MTALKKYERLESLGLWKESESDQRIEVIVSFGAASLVLSDANGKPLAHWSLAAVRTMTKNKTPVIYSPGHGSSETLEIDDNQMIEAIRQVRKIIRSVSPHPGRLSWIISGVILTGILALIFFWLPSISVDYATRIVPKAKAKQIGDDILKQTNNFTGQACNYPFSLPSLRKFEKWLLPKGGKIHIVDMGARFSAQVPGGNILLNRVLIEENAGPEVAAGFVLMERALATESASLTNMFQSIGTLATLTFIANGTLSNKLLATYAREMLTNPMTRPADTTLLPLFNAAKLNSGPFAYAIDATGQTTTSLISGNTMQNNYHLQITDADWIALQAICEDE